MERREVRKFVEIFLNSENFIEIIQTFQSIKNCVGNHNNIVQQLRILSNSQVLKGIEDLLQKRTIELKDAKKFNVCIVGAGPCGLRCALELKLLGCNVTVIEQRTLFSRNNVLHLWPFVIEDLKKLGAKILYPRFCTGSMNHISIKRLQCILLKISLLLGVIVHPGVEFVEIQEPTSKTSFWSVFTSPQIAANNLHAVIGAQGRRVTLKGFPRKEFRGKLAIAITANFLNRKTSAEAMVEEISGIAYVYKQDFFNNLFEELGIALENFVYYKDETHYFVMTTKKHSLMNRMVIKKDEKDPKLLLDRKNINFEKLLEYIYDTCDYCTDYQLPNLEFAINHHGEPDVSLFDFTSMSAAKNAIYLLERNSKLLMTLLVGDGLLEPFWPTGSGCARGFLGCLDACYSIFQWISKQKTITEIIHEREMIYRLLPQTTSDNIAKEYNLFTLDPKSRYPASMLSNKSFQGYEHLFDGNFIDPEPWKENFDEQDIGTVCIPKEMVKQKAKHFVFEKKIRINSNSRKTEETEQKKFKPNKITNLDKLDAIIKYPQTNFDIDLDNDVDKMLDVLEKDQDFQKMTENEQLSWLESLFYQDNKTITKKTLSKKQPIVSNHVRKEKNVINNVSVNTKMINLAQSFFPNNTITKVEITKKDVEENSDKKYPTVIKKEELIKKRLTNVTKILKK